MISIRFMGAAGEVTGSCYVLETSRARVLVDFGQNQGEKHSRERNEQAPAFEVSTLTGAIVTHAHIDHIGLLPRLRMAGYTGVVHATQATCELTAIMLRDAARLQQADAERDARRAERTGREPERALYSEADVEAFLPQLKPIGFGEAREISPGVRVTCVNSGHIVGSASVVFEVEDGGMRRRIVFSGDIGPSGVPMMQDPTPVQDADVVVMESTYGDRDHRPMGATLDEAAEIMMQAIWSRQRVLIPAFAVGRTQLVMYYLAKLARSGRVPRFPIYLDSPMAMEATKLYAKHLGTLDEEAREIFTPSLDVPGLRFVETAEESKRLNDLDGAAVIIAGSGMCNGGRIVHHLKHNVWKRDCHVMIVGYQAVGTLGRQLVDGAPMVRIFGEEIVVRAKVHTLGGFSAHAGQTELVAWAKRAGARPRFILTHGEDAAREALRLKLYDVTGVKAECPQHGEVVGV
jgi:metallo-beta-lactamase family protein